ncbi:coiled-coil domain-containing protein 30 isoform X1 [Perca flavescens]|uniref:coiled-coil domain-containing protein 30 isoform X1 n=1 Tax=Perca flavescens TaxID=8167 RepID=UPI00106EF046|nr:coiled-coil domain-containing protein 30-like isoform X1 [Perca flavescens]
MDQPEEEPEQIATWFSEQGLPVDSPVEAKLRLLWSALQRTRSCLSSVTWELDTQRSQHLAEMAEVRKSLEQIRIFTEHKDVLAQEIQDENDQLKEQLRRLISLQDAQINEVAKMLYQQGLTELIHSSPSEQVAYLLVERASLLEMSEDPNNLTGDGNTVSLLGSEAQALNTSAHQSSHKGAPRHSQSPWKRLFGLHKASQSKHTFVPAEPRHLAGQASSMERECSRLERDLEEASRRLAMAHNEIRRLTDELESAHLTQKDYDVVELRKAKELNDCLDLEIRALRSRVRTLDAEKSSLQQTVASLQREVERLQSVLQEQQQQLLTVQVQAKQANELAKIRSDTSHNDLDYPIATTCSKENNLQDQKLWKQNEADLENCENTHCHLREHKELQTELLLLQNKENTLRKECPHCQEAVMTLLTTQEECKTLKDEICEALKCLDKERSKYHEMKEKHKAKLCRAKQKCDDETTWRDKKIKTLERELSFCSHSVAKEKELTISITAENEKLLVERRRLLQQLNEEEHNKNDSNLTASLSQCRVDFLEMENKKLGNKILHMSKQLAVLERGLQNMQSLHFAEVPGPERKKTSNLMQVFKSLPLQTSSVMMPESSDIQGLLDNTPSKQTAVTYYPHCLISGPLSRSAEMGYLNLTSAPGRSDHSTPLAALSSS